MMAALAALAASLGTAYLYSACFLGWGGLRLVPRRTVDSLRLGHPRTTTMEAGRPPRHAGTTSRAGGRDARRAGGMGGLRSPDPGTRRRGDRCDRTRSAHGGLRSDTAQGAGDDLGYITGERSVSLPA